MSTEKCKVEETLKYIKRREYTDDLHSFVATIENGRTFVSYWNKKFYVTCYVWRRDEEDTLEFIFDNIDECRNKLIELGIKPETIDI